MSELKTRPTRASVARFIGSIEDERQRKDAKRIDQIMRSVTGSNPVLWGSSLVGYGRYDYRYASGREGSWFLTGFSPRKRNLVIYVMSGFSTEPALMRRLGRHKTGRSCLYLRKLDDVDLDVLTELVRRSVELIRKRHG